MTTKETQETTQETITGLDYVNANENGLAAVAYAVKNNQMPLEDSGLTQAQVDEYFTEGANERDANLAAPAKASKAKKGETEETE